MPVKNWLPWLDDDEKDQLRSLIELVTKNHFKNKWENSTIKDDFPGPWIIEIGSIEEMMLAVGMFKAQLKYFNTSVYYRGQSEDYPLFPKLFRNLEDKSEVLSMYKKCEEAMKLIEHDFAPEPSHDDEKGIRTAMATHYGCKTWWLDVVDHPHTAVWFAYNTSKDQGYIYLLAIPQYCARSHRSQLIRVIDLRISDALWLRPHTQQALAICDLKQNRLGDEMSYLCVAKFILKREMLKSWANKDLYTEHVIFPDNKIDSGLISAINAQGKLKLQGFKNIWPEVK